MYHGDLEHDADDENWEPCIRNGNSALNIFLFAFTTQTTIGNFIFFYCLLSRINDLTLLIL